MFSTTSAVCESLRIRPKQLRAWVRRGLISPATTAADGSFRWSATDLPRLATVRDFAAAQAAAKAKIAAFRKSVAGTQK
jgi:DNA-binding transcriptional MerR regulator